jgi:hypothetical protein
MSSMGRKSEPPKTADANSKKQQQPRRADDDDHEDGDIATPKRDREGNDDEPL